MLQIIIIALLLAEDYRLRCTWPFPSILGLQENEQAKGYESNYNLRKARKTTQPKEDSQCPECNKTFTNERGLKAHLKTVHYRKQLFKCEFCDKTRTTKGNLTQHIKQSHSNKV